MKRFILFFACVISYIGGQAKHVTAVVTEPGQLQSIVSRLGVWKYDITSLKVIGPIDSDDIVFIRDLMGTASFTFDYSGNYEYNAHYSMPKTDGKLNVLDLSEATIVKSMNYYFYGRCCDGTYEDDFYTYCNRTKDNVVSLDFFNNFSGSIEVKFPINATSISGSLANYNSRDCKFSPIMIGPKVENNYLDVGNEYTTTLSEIYCLSTTPPKPVYENGRDKYKYLNNKKFSFHVPKGFKDIFQLACPLSTILEGVLIQKIPDWASDNHDDNTTSSRTTKVHIPAGGTLSFDYAVSSEEDCDYLTVTINGKKLVNKSGNASGTYTGTFDNEVIGDLVVKYSKDEMSAGGTDNASIKNMTLTMPENGYYEESYMQIGCDNFVFFDCEHFDMFVDFVAPKLTYRRTFNNTEWQALYVPFSIAYDEWQNDFEIARLNDVHQFDNNNDGVIDRTALEIVKLTSGRTEANTPYVIRAKSTGEKDLVMTNVKVSSIEGGGCMVSSWNTNFYFTGCYEPVSGTTMKNEGYYALGTGTLHQAASENNKLGSNRWYMEATDRYGNQLNISEVKMFVFGEDVDDMETRVLGPKQETECGSVFDMSGRKIVEKRDGLRPGIYVQNGKKFIVK